MIRRAPGSTLFPYATLFRSKRDYVPAMALASLAAGADGLMIEVHPDPDHAASDGAQTLSFEGFKKLLESLRDRKSTRLNSSHMSISYAVFCLKKKIKKRISH